MHMGILLTSDLVLVIRVTSSSALEKWPINPLSRPMLSIHVRGYSCSRVNALLIRMTAYQLSKVPPRMQAQHAIFGGSTYFSETPAHADVQNHKLKHGDVVIFATDGVWDNLSAQDTLQIVQRVMEDGGYWFKSHNFAGAETMVNETLIRSLPRAIEVNAQEPYLPGQLAAAIMREAKVAGLDRRREGPFAKEVKRHYPQEGWEGGKPDDIAVVVCLAVQEETTGAASPIKAKL